MTLLLAVIYYAILGPVALGARALGKRLLDLDFATRPSYWVRRDAADKSLAALRRQY